MTGQVQGVKSFRQILSLSADIPVVAIRGGNHKTASPLWQTGGESIAVVSAITEAHDAETAILPLQTPFSKKYIDRISPNNISH